MTPRSAPGPRITEKSFQKQVIELAQRYGWKVAAFRTALSQAGNWMTPVQGDGKGWPDLFMVRGNRAIALELKVGYNKPTEEQWDWLGSLKDAGIDAYMVTPKHWDLIETVLTRMTRVTSSEAP